MKNSEKKEWLETEIRFCEQTKLETDLLAEFEKSIEDKIYLYKTIIKKNNEIIKLTKDEKESGLTKTENIELKNKLMISEDSLENVRKQRGTINNIFRNGKVKH